MKPKPSKTTLSHHTLTQQPQLLLGFCGLPSDLDPRPQLSKPAAAKIFQIFKPCANPPTTLLLLWEGRRCRAPARPWQALLGCKGCRPDHNPEWSPSGSRLAQALLNINTRNPRFEAASNWTSLRLRPGNPCQRRSGPALTRGLSGGCPRGPVAVAVGAAAAVAAAVGVT